MNTQKHRIINQSYPIYKKEQIQTGRFETYEISPGQVQTINNP